MRIILIIKVRKKYRNSNNAKDIYYSKNNGHRIAEVRAGNNVSPAKNHVKGLLGVAERLQVSRIKELLNILTVEDVHEYVLPSVCKSGSLYDVLSTQNSLSVSGNQNEDLLKKTFLSFPEEVNKTYETELEYVFNCMGCCKTTDKLIPYRSLSTAIQSRPTLRPMISKMCKRCHSTYACIWTKFSEFIRKPHRCSWSFTTLEKKKYSVIY